MFSPMIQNLLSSSGQMNAMQRAVQMNNYVNSINSQWAPIDKTTQIETQTTNNIKPFDEVLKASAKTKFGELISNPTTRVSAEIYSSTANNISGKKDYSSKAKIKELISKVSQKHGIDEKLVNALVNQESGFNPNARSKVGAMGLMQLMPATAKGLGVTNPMDPEQNVEGGVKYLKSMLNKYNGNIILALAAYNAGPNAVDKYDGVPPYKETQNYVKSILSSYL
ncbi:MAG: lytic transglycosylase domain-containing protein [Cyanobacteria bacterium SIG31]|nr:lytic transglycosylase domain-containing protein [Cyanobacteria bacterium SIG31]